MPLWIKGLRGAEKIVENFFRNYVGDMKNLFIEKNCA